MKKFLLGIAVLAITMLMPASAAMADETRCVGTLPPGTYDNILVPEGATCALQPGTRVEGNVVVKGGANLDANNVRVDGNVQAERSNSVVIRNGSRIGGSVQAEGLSTGLEVRNSRVNGDVKAVQGRSAEITDSVVGGTILIDDNRQAKVDVSRNQVGGNVQVFQNRNSGITIFNNVIDENLQCKQNRPPPTGGGNVVGGNTEDQCRSFGSRPPSGGDGS